MSSDLFKKGPCIIPNILMDAILLYGFTKVEMHIVFCICREVYGWKDRTSARVGLSYIGKKTGIKKNHLSEPMNNLINRNIIQVVKEHTASTEREVTINENLSEWVSKTGTVTKKVTVTKKETEQLQFPELVSSENGNTPVPKSVTSISTSILNSIGNISSRTTQEININKINFEVPDFENNESVIKAIVILFCTLLPEMKAGEDDVLLIFQLLMNDGRVELDNYTIWEIIINKMKYAALDPKRQRMNYIETSIINRKNDLYNKIMENEEIKRARRENSEKVSVQMKQLIEELASKSKV